MADGKPSVLIVGGLVDKVLPQLAHLAPEFTEACSNAVFLQADASREQSMSRIFDHPDIPGGKWDYVFNLGGESAWSQTYEIYKLRSHQLSVTLAKESAKRGVGVFVEASTGMVYSSNKTPRVESDKLKPWTKMAKVKLETEIAMSKLPGLNLVILRMPHVYGDYDHKYVSKVLCIARVHQEQSNELKLLWTEDLRVNTLHVEDAARALWTAAEWKRGGNIMPPSPTLSRRNTLSKGEEGPVSDTPVFNIVDHGETTLGDVSKIIGEVFGIKTGFQGTIISQFAKLNLDSVVDDLNEDFLQPWADMIERAEITRPGPLSPFLEKELLKDSDLSMDGSLFEKTTGFKYLHEKFTADEARKLIESYKRMNWWP
ncbi:hypothetical protein LTS08_007059 [Lithohypha guttulata]|nr:hypothetical protein LTS08_007059 [Lithohypha guttulata]